MSFPAISAFGRGLPTMFSRAAVTLMSPTPGVTAELFDVECPKDSLCLRKSDGFEWITPSAPGDYRIKVDVNLSYEIEPGNIKTTHKAFTLTGIVSVPAEFMHDGVIDGFTIGIHPLPKDDSNIRQFYNPPSHYYELNRDNWGLHMSEHFKLGQMGFDNDEDLPQYSALDYELVRKMESIMTELEAWGYPHKISFIGGGFISPKNNITRCNKVRAAASMSRHMFGDAIDFIVDEDGDGVMDDMDGDGLVSLTDAIVIREIVDYLEEQDKCKIGGVGVYSPPRNSKVQLHVDTRGYKARWGPEEDTLKIKSAGLPIDLFTGQ